MRLGVRNLDPSPPAVFGVYRNKIADTFGSGWRPSMANAPGFFNLW